MGKKKTLQISRGDLEAAILSSMEAAGYKGAPLSKLGRPRSGEAQAMFDAVLHELMEAGRVRRLPGKTPKYRSATSEPGREVLAARIRENAEEYGPQGATLKQLGGDFHELPLFAGVLQESVSQGDLVVFEKNQKKKYYAAKYAPPSELDLFREEVLRKVEPTVAWLENDLVKSGAKAALRRQALETLVREGHLLRIFVVKGATSRQVAYLATGTVGKPERQFPPEWEDIERAAREMARTQWDGTVGFQELASRLGVSTLYIKTAVDQQMQLQGPIQLIPGDPRSVDNEEVAGLEWNGRRYLRFRLL